MGKWLGVALALVVVCAYPLRAQDFRATITGQVTDSSGAIIPNAVVKATNLQTNEVAQAKTSEAGVYALPYLQPGRYTVVVTASGFDAIKRENIVLEVAEKLNLRVKLRVGQMSQEVTVSGQQELIQSQNADRGLVFDPITTQELPLNGRQAYMLMQLTPGVIFTQQQFGANGFSGTRGWDVNGSYRINGGRSGTNQFLLNGAPISVNGSWQLSPNVESIQEFKVQTSTYDAQFGRTGGGTVNTVLKSGTNQLHGDVFEYWRNNILDANTVQNNAAGKPKGYHNQHQFGGVVTFPVRKDKDFVMLSFEGWQEVVPFPVLTSTPPLDIRDGQHFSEYNIKVYDPLTSRPCTIADKCPSGTNYVRNPFAGNVIPSTRISGVGQKILSLYPAPNFLGSSGPLSNNFLQAQNSGRYGYFQPIGRWDHVFSDKSRFNALVTEEHGHEYRNNNGFDPPAQRGNIHTERSDQNYIADFTRIMSPTTVLDVRGSFGRFTSNFPDGDNDFGFTYDQLGILNMPIPPTVDRKTAPHFYLQGFPDIIGTTFSWDTWNQYDFAPSVTQTHGKQTWHYGFEWALMQHGQAGPGQATGRLNFDSNLWTRRYDGKDLGFGDGWGLASLLLGTPNSGNIDYNGTSFRSWQYYAFYFQDDWKIAPRLTLNLGLRYDIQRPFVERYDRTNGGFDYGSTNPYSDAILANWNQIKAQWDPQHPGNPYPDAPSAILGGKLFPGVNGQPRRSYNTDWTDVQPRIGFAYRVTDTTVLRGGFGIYHKWDDHANTADGFNQSTNYVNTLNGQYPSAGLTGPYSLQNPFPDGVMTPPGSSLGLATNVGNGIGFDTRIKPIPRTYEFSLGLQQQLPYGMVLSADYSGNRGYHDTVSLQIDYLSPDRWNSARQNANVYTQNVPNPFYGILPATTDFGKSTSIQAANLYRPYPEFNGITRYTNPWGTYQYDSLQMSLKKRAFNSRSTGVLTFVFSYTFEKSFEANHFLGTKNPGVGNCCIGYEGNELIHELDYQDKPQNIAFSGVWDLPVGRNKRWGTHMSRALDALVGGWTLDWIYTFYSGYPAGKPDAVFGPVGNTPAGVCSTYVAQHQSYDQWFNNFNGIKSASNPNGYNCYSDYPAFSLRDGEDRFAWIREPDYGPQINMALEKTFRFNERYSLQFRGEAFNLVNTPIMGGPNTDWHSTNFGKVTIQQQNFPRVVQLAAKVYF